MNFTNICIFNINISTVNKYTMVKKTKITTDLTQKSKNEKTNTEQLARLRTTKSVAGDEVGR
jgi:hypothetical protein